VKSSGTVGPTYRVCFGALTPVALRAPCVSAPKQRSVYHVLGTKCLPCAGLDSADTNRRHDRRRCRQDFLLHVLQIRQGLAMFPLIHSRQGISVSAFLVAVSRSVVAPRCLAQAVAVAQVGGLSPIRPARASPTAARSAGRISRDKLLFFGNWQGTSIRQDPHQAPGLEPHKKGGAGPAKACPE